MASKPGRVDDRREAGADDDVGQVPSRVRRVQDEPPVPPTAGPRGVEGWRHRLASRSDRRLTGRGADVLVSHRLAGPT